MPTAIPVEPLTSKIEEMNAGRERIVVTEIPYMVNKARLIEHIAELVKNNAASAHPIPHPDCRSAG